MNTVGGFAVRVMRPQDVEIIRAWADSEGWNPGTHDGPMFHATDPDGFFVGERHADPVACISCVRYGEAFGFLGQYIVRPDCRGRGFGLAVWNAGMAHLSGRNVGLEGVPAQVPNYERSGFRFAHHTVRFAGTGGGTRPAGLVSLRDVPFAAVVGYDTMCFPARREAFIRGLVALPESVGLAATAGARLVGYGVLRKSANGYKVGPLFADDAGTAEQLLAGLVSTSPDQPFYLDVPADDAQPSGGSLARTFGLTEVFRTARMYTAGIPTFDSTRVYGVTSLELG